jgi:hypothetical protein
VTCSTYSLDLLNFTFVVAFPLKAAFARVEFLISGLALLKVTVTEPRNWGPGSESALDPRVVDEILQSSQLLREDAVSQTGAEIHDSRQLAG